MYFIWLFDEWRLFELLKNKDEDRDGDDDNDEEEEGENVEPNLAV